MKLNLESINENQKWSDAGYILPGFDIEKSRMKAAESPEWIHFGAGNILRSFMAHDLQKLLREGHEEAGMIVCDGFDFELIDNIYKNHDNLSVLVTLNADGTMDKEIIGSISEALAMDRARAEDFHRLKEIFRNPSLKMVSFTLTEKGYNLSDKMGRLLDSVVSDIKAGPELADGYMGKITSLMYERYRAGELPVAMVSMDNFSHNGDRLKDAVMTLAKGWAEENLAETGFVDYLCDESKVSFPWSMIDKITPRPDSGVCDVLKQDGVENVEPVITEKKTYASIYVNAERPQYLVIEDLFPNGRPSLDKAGVIFTDRDTVNNTERMKVCTCLNPLHTALAIFGCLLMHVKIADEMEDEVLKNFVYEMGYKEGLPVVTDPGIIKPEDFIREVLEERVTNPFMPDTPQRIATDTSQKLPIRFGETIKAYMSSSELDSSKLKFVPLVLAGWLRYLMAVDDNGDSFELSPDPMMHELTPQMKGISLGETDRTLVEDKVSEILTNQKIFGVDLQAAGLYEKIIDMFMEMIQGAGAVRETLLKYERTEI